RETCAPDAPGAKSARTVYETIAACADASVVRAEPVTGRTHQLRVHFASLGCPIAGDGFYGTAETVPTAYDAAMTRQALHAVSLVIERTSGTLTLEAPPPPDIRALYEKIKES
ncbi:MAG: RNA pseudouridine synthase, partial [Clostridia bacterium]|nr:RNA pseudouridine synthase [Clostridia bacterium]